MAQVQSKETFRDRLPAEVDAWQREGLISAEQGRAILERYDARTGRGRLRALRLDRVTALVSVVGALALGMGIIIFFAASWHTLPAWSKVTLIVTATAAAYTSGYWLQVRRASFPRVGASLMLLGAVLFQTALFLLAQLAHLPTDNPLLLLIGTAGALPPAYALGSQPLLLFGLLDGLACLGWTLEKAFPNTPESFAIPLLSMLTGVLLYAAGRLHARRGDPHLFSSIYQVLGLLLILVPTYSLTFGGVWDSMRTQDLSSLHVPLWFAGVIVLTLVGAASLLTGRADARIARIETGAFATVTLIVALVAYMPQWAGMYALLFNVLFLCGALLICSYGYLEGEARFVNTGIVFLALGLFTRYCDTFWPLLPQSAFFMIAGLVLLGVAAGLERVRRRLLHSMGAGT